MEQYISALFHLCRVGFQFTSPYGERRPNCGGEYPARIFQFTPLCRERLRHFHSDLTTYLFQFTSHIGNDSCHCIRQTQYGFQFTSPYGERRCCIYTTGHSRAQFQFTLHAGNDYILSEMASMHLHFNSRSYAENDEYSQLLCLLTLAF